MDLSMRKASSLQQPLHALAVYSLATHGCHTNSADTVHNPVLICGRQVYLAALLMHVHVRMRLLNGT